MNSFPIDVIGLTGLTTGLIGTLLYKAGHHTFMSGGRFQSKPISIIILFF